VQLHRERNRLEELGAGVLVLTFDLERRARALYRSGEIPFPVLLDPGRKVYAAYRLERSLWRCLRPNVTWFYFKKLLRGQGYSRVTVDPTQLGGDFIIDRDGVIRYAYYSYDPTDRPTVEQIVCALSDS